MGGIEKVLEYRPVPNGKGAIELRRIAASADGPVEHRQVVEPVPNQTLPPEVSTAPWLHFEGPPSQAAALAGMWGITTTESVAQVMCTVYLLRIFFVQSKIC